MSTDDLAAQTAATMPADSDPRLTDAWLERELERRRANDEIERWLCGETP